MAWSSRRTSAPTRQNSRWRSTASIRARIGRKSRRTNKRPEFSNPASSAPRKKKGLPRRPFFSEWKSSATQHAQELFEFHAHLFDDLLTLAHVDASLFARELVSRTTDGEALLVQQAADLADDDDVLPLVVPAVTAALHGLQLRKFLLPVTQHVRLHAAELAHFPDREIALAGDCWEFVVILWFQHTLRLEPSVSDRDGTSPRDGR